jgi:PAS domain S-box-containing protein
MKDDGEGPATNLRAERILESITDGFFALDEGWRFTYVNPQFEHILGLAAREVLGKVLWEVYPGLLDNELGRMYHRVVGGRVSESATVYYPDHDRWYEAHAYPAEDGLYIYFRDVSERMRIQAERERVAEESERERRIYQAALSNTPDLVYVFDLNHRFIYANEALLTMWGRRLEDALGKDCLELGYEPWHAAMHGREIDQVVATGKQIRGEVPFNGTNGARIYDYIFVPVFGADGTVQAVAGTTRDVTERKAAEEATLRRSAQFQRLADVANRINSAHDVPSIVGVVTEEARQLIGGRQSATSMLPDHRDSKPLDVTIPHGGNLPDATLPGLDGLRLYEAEALGNEPIRLTRQEIEAEPRWQLLRRPSDDRLPPNGWLAAPLVGRNGKRMGLIQVVDRLEGEFTADDEVILAQIARLTSIAIENARLYQKLRSNDERKDEFLAMLAHELRNPLAAIGNAVKLTDEEKDREWSKDVIARQMKHLSHLIDDLMDVSRITRGKIQLRRDVLDLKPILESATSAVRTLIEERKHQLELDIDQTNLWVHVDPTRLEQVLVNLLNNAAKYSENAGRILLSVRHEKNQVVVAVKDTGVGIPPEELPEMFELFAQGDRSLARSEGGLGIGLTVVKKLVEMHGGTVTAQSEGIGKGSEFTIRLPSAPKPLALSPQPDEPQQMVSRRMKILVVDDHVDTARGMARLLRRIGHDVTTAHNGPEGIEAARAHSPEFILLDIGLPGMSGYEVAVQLKKEESCKNAVIVAISGYGQAEDRRRSRQAGFDHHLVKPLDHDALLALLRRNSPQ